MDLETFVIAVFCLVDDFVRDLCRGWRLRQRGPAPVLADSEVLTIEAVGEFLGLDTDRALHAHFRRHFGHLFPGLRAVHRTTFLRQAANLWAVKQALWQRLAAATRRDAALALGLPLRPRPPLPGLPGVGRLRLRRARAPDLLRPAPAPTRDLARRGHRGGPGAGERRRPGRRAPAPRRAGGLGARRQRLLEPGAARRTRRRWPRPG